LNSLSDIFFNNSNASFVISIFVLPFGFTFFLIILAILKAGEPPLPILFETALIIKENV
jgi:hypothetical protein